jgi:hypothetical protein
MASFVVLGSVTVMALIEDRIEPLQRSGRFARAMICNPEGMASGPLWALLGCALNLIQEGA